MFLQEQMSNEWDLHFHQYSMMEKKECYYLLQHSNLHHHHLCIGTTKESHIRYCYKPKLLVFTHIKINSMMTSTSSKKELASCQRYSCSPLIIVKYLCKNFVTLQNHHQAGHLRLYRIPS